MARIDINTISAQELHDLARATWAMHNGDVGVTRMGDMFQMFDLRDATETVNMPVAHTPPERLLAHFKGFVVNRAF
jgi:hypothetical protein